MKSSATFSTAFGVSVPIFDHPTVPGEYLFGMDATAICAGIYDPKERARFAADAAAAGRADLDRLPEYGGGRPKHLTIPIPGSPAFPQIRDTNAVVPIDNWVTAIMDQQRWCDRADVLLKIIGSNFDQRETFGSNFDPILTLGMQIMLSGALEHLTEREIDCLEAAAFYALTVHDEWIEPAIEWLRPMSGTWFKDWVAARPAYRRFARFCRKDTDLPRWIEGGRA